MAGRGRALAVRPIVHVDPARCLGCGQCLGSCPQGALAIDDHLASLVNDAWCDGRGVCLGHCSADALSIRPRPAVPFDQGGRRPG